MNTRGPLRTALSTALALGILTGAGSALAESGRDDQAVPSMPYQPIVDGKDLQPRQDEVTPGVSRERLSADPELKALYEGVMRDSDPSNYRRNREPVAR